MAVLRPAPSRGTAGHGVAAKIWLLMAALALLLASPVSTSAAPAESREYQIKAVFLFNFAQFVEWPAEAFSNADSPLVIGILGKDPFGAYLDEAVSGEKVNGRPIVIVRYARIENIAKCHILFISQSEASQLEQDLADLKGRGVLTVSDLDKFSQLGGMIHFVMKKNKVRLRINNGAARAAGLRISSKLLRPSEVVSIRLTHLVRATVSGIGGRRLKELGQGDSIPGDTGPQMADQTEISTVSQSFSLNARDRTCECRETPGG